MGIKVTLESDTVTVRLNGKIVDPIIKDMRRGRCAFCEKLLKDSDKTYDWVRCFASIDESFENLKVDAVVVNECCSRKCHIKHSSEMQKTEEDSREKVLEKYLTPDSTPKVERALVL